MRVLVTGAGGMLGNAVTQYCSSFSGDQVVPLDHARLDIRALDLVMHTLKSEAPDIVINCAAWTDVDGCELDQDKAFAVNADGPENLARASRAVAASFVTVSTDYVFDGDKGGFYTQRDDPNPKSIYGKSKLAGERRAQTAYARTIVTRTGFVFGAGGKNFLSTIVERAGRGEKLKVIKDAWGTPTYARDLAVRLRELALMDLPGTFHVVNEGDGVSYEQFARTALEIAGCTTAQLENIEMAQLHRPAPRPVNSRLRCLLSPAVGLAPLPFWKDSLNHFTSPVCADEAGAKA